MKEVSYIKTQWWRLLIALFCFVMACIYGFRPSPDTSTVEGLDQMFSYTLTFLMYLSNFLIWFYASIFDYYNDRLEVLEKKAEKYDALCELVQELVEANRIDRELDRVQNAKIKKLEERLK